MNRQSSRWICENKQAKTELLQAILDIKVRGKLSYHIDDLTVLLSWDQWIMQELLDTLDMSKYCVIRDDEGGMFLHCWVGGTFIEGVNIEDNHLEELNIMGETDFDVIANKYFNDIVWRAKMELVRK